MRRVHDADVVEVRGRNDDVPGQQHQGGRGSQIADDTHKSVEQAGSGYLFEHLSRLYGFAFLLLLFCILFALSLCFPEYTVWSSQGGASSTTPPSNGTTATLGKTTVPTVRRSAWMFFQGLAFPTIVALRTMFATSTGDPHPLPGSEEFTWKYAPQYVWFCKLPICELPNI